MAGNSIWDTPGPCSRWIICPQLQPVEIIHPKFVNVPLAKGLRWTGGGGWRCEEKMDGDLKIKELNGAILAGEQMRDGRYFVFDILEYKKQDIRNLSLRESLAILDSEYAGQFLRPATGNGAEFLESVLSRGGEGVVAKYLDDSYGKGIWHKCKRVETFDLVVTEKYMPSIRLRSLDGVNGSKRVSS